MSKTFAQAILLAETQKIRNDKFATLGSFNTVEKKLLHEAFNPYRVFNIRKYDWPSAFASVDPSYDTFFKLLDSLHDRTITGNNAKIAVTAVLGSYTEETATVLARVINKDLECGANRDSFEKIYSDLGIPQFELMLAGKIEEIAEETPESKKAGKIVLTKEILANKYGLIFPVQAEAKYDGNRLLAMVNNGSIEYLSRSGKSSDYCAGLFDEELLKIEAEIGPFVLDGEVLGKSFQDTMNAKGDDRPDAKANLRFFAFDYMTLAEWKARDCKAKQLERSQKLEALINKIGCVGIVKSKYKICLSIAELREFYAEVLAEGINSDGTLNGLGEGLIIKAVDGFYEWERSGVVRDRKTQRVTKGIYWVKWKPVLDLDLEVVGFELGKGRLSKTIGKLLLEGKDENGNKIKASCGSGLDDKTRDYILKNQAKLLGKIVMIECQELSLAAGSTVYSARFPVFIKFRDDK